MIRNESSHKLTPNDVLRIAELREVNRMTYQEIAAQFGVHWNTISRACRGETYKHVDRPIPTVDLIAERVRR